LAPQSHGVHLTDGLQKPPTCNPVESARLNQGKDHSAGTVKAGDGLCPFPDCGRVIDGDEVKGQS